MILILIVILVLTLPLLFKRIEEALEIFLLIMGLITLTITSQWSLHLIKEILLEPIKITITVFVAGILFNIIQKTIENNIGVIADKIGVKLFVPYFISNNTNIICFFVSCRAGVPFKYRYCNYRSINT